MYTKADIKALLTTNDRAVTRAIVAVYGFQTQSERSSKTTADLNGIGFNGADAEILSSFAEQIQKGRQLSERQMEIARRKIVKYSQQLANIANNTQRV